jgi:paraquat-inducible protein A
MAASSSSVPSAKRLICEHCDSVYRRRELRRGEVSLCPVCGAVLERHQRLGNDALPAVVLTALIAFAQGNIWPIVTITLNGQASSARLWDMIIIMWQDQAQIVAVITAFTLFFFPLMNLLSLGWLLVFARRGTRAPGFRPLMVALHHLRPWTMSEVFVLGAIVAMVKAQSYFEVTPDKGIYAYGVLMLLVTTVAGLDLRRLWDRIPEVPR